MNLAERMMDLVERLRQVGLVGERKALALLCLGFYATQLLLSGLLARDALPEMAPLLLALGAYYGLGFFSVAADWFWGRWFAGGIGAFGVSMSAWGLLTVRELNPVLLFILGTHGVISLCLMGEKMAAVYDAQEHWRKRFGLDEQGVLRVRRSVQRAATTLPVIILMALSPKTEESLGVIAVLALASVGLVGVLRARTWGVLSLGAAGVLGLVAAVSGMLAIASHGSPVDLVVSDLPASMLFVARPLAWDARTGQMLGMVHDVARAPGMLAFAAVLLLAAAAPFAAPIKTWLRRR
jgi:hypothetical protein